MIIDQNGREWSAEEAIRLIATIVLELADAMGQTSIFRDQVPRQEMETLRTIFNLP